MMWTFKNIGDNLRTIYNDSESPLDEHVRESLKKLLDHVNLEIVRLSYMKQIFAETKDDADARDTNESLFNSLRERFDKTEADLKKLRKKMQSQQRDYVAILGIFATIVVAFASGIGASFSFMKEAAGNADIFLTGIAAIGILMISSIYGLFVCLRSVINKDGTNDLCVWPIYLFIALFILLFIGRKFLTV